MRFHHCLLLPFAATIILLTFDTVVYSQDDQSKENKVTEDNKNNSTVRQSAVTLKLKTDDGEAFEISFWLYLPPKIDRSKKLPLLMFLHGAGERGDDLNVVKKWGPPRQIEKGKDFSAIVVSPQCPKGRYWNVEELKALLDHLIKKHNIDTDRIYATGLSMGGYGTWAFLAKYPDFLAAGIPICGGGEPEQARKFAKVPVWAFHGDADKVVPVERTNEMIEALKKADGTPKVTIYEGVGHNSWSQTYSNEKVYRWLFEQKKTIK